jgi:hypothetical protein
LNFSLENSSGCASALLLLIKRPHNAELIGIYPVLIPANRFVLALHYIVEGSEVSVSTFLVHFEVCDQFVFS